MFDTLRQLPVLILRVLIIGFICSSFHYILINLVFSRNDLYLSHCAKTWINSRWKWHKAKEFVCNLYIFIGLWYYLVTGSLGSYTKITNLNLGTTRVGISQSYGVRTWTVQRPQLYSGLSISRRSEKVLHVRSAPSLEIICKFFCSSISKSSNLEFGYQFLKVKTWSLLDYC